MKITTFSFCILGALAGVWMADLGAWPSAGGIWVICIILAIDGAARPRVAKEEPERQRTISTPGGLGRIPESEGPPRPFYKPGYTPPPPPKKPANPFKVGDRVRHGNNAQRVGVVSSVMPGSVRVEWKPAEPNDFSWISPESLELISEKTKFKVGDRVRDKITGASGTIDEILEKRALVNFSPIGRAGFAVPGWMYLEDLELICEKQS